MWRPRARHCHRTLQRPSDRARPCPDSFPDPTAAELDGRRVLSRVGVTITKVTPKAPWTGSGWGGAPSAIRTRDLLLRRHSPGVARRCQAWPDVLFSCTDSGWKWPGVAQYLSLLAPHLAPRDLLSLSNVRTNEHSLEPTCQERCALRRSARQPPTRASSSSVTKAEGGRRAGSACSVRLGG
jgi:hypothetical protein